MRRRTKKGVRTHEQPSPAPIPPEEVLPEEEAEVLGEYWPAPYRPPKRRIGGALLFSLLFHLSMVTVFRIVVQFPRSDIKYHHFRIVQAAPSPAPAGEAAAVSTPPLDGQLALSGGDSLPMIELPTIEFSELSRFRLWQENMEAPSRYGELLAGGPGDSWDRFVTGMRELPEKLTQLSLSRREELPSVPASVQNTIALHPAPEVAGELDWDGAPKDRELLFAPPIDAFWQAGREAFAAPIELVIEVNPAGRVVNVWSGALDETGLADRVQLAMLKYRFAPLEGERTSSQFATVRFAPEVGAP